MIFKIPIQGSTHQRYVQCNSRFSVQTSQSPYSHYSPNHSHQNYSLDTYAQLTKPVSRVTRISTPSSEIQIYPRVICLGQKSHFLLLGQNVHGVGHPIEHCKFFPDYFFLPFMRYESPSLTHYGYWYHWCLGVTSWSSLEIKLETLISVMSYVPIRKFNMLNLLYGYWTRKN